MLFRLEQLVKRRSDTFSLGPLDATLSPGEILGVMGPNGAGKTTLLKLLWGFLRPDGGRVLVFGREPHIEQVRIRMSAGYLSESPKFYEWMSVNRFLSFVGGFYPAWDGTRACELLGRFGLHENELVGNLSKGGRVKLGLVAAMAHRPRLLLLDEPTAGLDPLVRTDVLDILREMAAREETGIVLSSHVSADLDRVSDSVLMLNQGRIIEYAPTRSLLAKYSRGQLEEVFLNALGRIPTSSVTHRA